MGNVFKFDMKYNTCIKFLKCLNLYIKYLNNILENIHRIFTNVYKKIKEKLFFKKKIGAEIENFAPSCLSKNL